MKVFKKISWLALALFVVMPLAFASAKKNQNRNRWMLNKSVVQSIDTSLNVITVTRGGTTYTINYTDTTRILRKYNATAAETEIVAGDKLKIHGTISGTTVTANKIRDLSIKKGNGKFKGNVTSVDCASSPNTFVLHTRNRGDRTITLNDSANIKYHGTAKTCADLDQRQRITVVKGIWNTNTNAVYNVSKIKITKW